MSENEGPYKFHCTDQECFKVIGPGMPIEGTTEHPEIRTLNFAYAQGRQSLEAELKEVRDHNDTYVHGLHEDIKRLMDELKAKDERIQVLETALLQVKESLKGNPLISGLDGYVDEVMKMEKL